MNSRSPLFDRLAQLLVLYERIRIEAFAAATTSDESKALRASRGGFRVQDSLQRSIATLRKFASALHKVSQTDEYKLAEKKFEGDREMKNLFATVSKASRHFHADRDKLRGASRIAAPEFAGTPTKDAMCTIRDGFTHATRAMHALVAAFVCDRL